ncbi:MAG: iron ABC transporter permease [Pseudomonadota bacterium]|nr:iron ABC transporter permease [Pseudomonadota bacterium]
MSGRLGGVALWSLLCILIALLSLWSLTVGASGYGMGDVLRAIGSNGDDRVALVVNGVRLPRVLAALIVGATLALAGAIMQAVTGNPMADPGLLGVNAGAAFLVVVALAFFNIDAAGQLVWFAFAGAAGAAVLVYALGSGGRGGATPLKLILAGVVVASFLGAVTMAVLVVDGETFDAVRLWTAGSLKGREMSQVAALAPYALMGCVGAVMMARQFTALSLGGEVATGLGQRQGVWRAVALALVVVLAGSAVALAGPVGFVGLVVPHIVRLVGGADYGRILPFAILVGAGLTLLADTLPRALWHRDMPVGISMALIGAPVFIWLARRNVGRAA